MEEESKGTIGWKMAGNITTWPAKLKIKNKDGHTILYMDRDGHIWDGEGVCGYPICNEVGPHTAYHEKEERNDD